jgi:hypothetical protein
MLIGKVVDDGLPLSINMNNPIRGRVLHLMSDSCLRLKDFVFAIAHGIDAQYKPFADPNPAASTDTPLLSYAVVNHWPLDWEWMDEQKAHKGRIPLISALKENGSVVQDFMEKMIAEWRSKKQTGLFFLPELAELISIPKGTQLVRYIDSLLNTPDKDVRFIVTSRYTDYTPTPHITPVISIENDWLSPFFSRDGQWKYKDGNLWRTFDILRPKLTNVQAETGK